MDPRPGWNSSAAEREPLLSGTGSLQLTLLFGAAAVTLALLVTPLLDRRVNSDFARNDMMVDRMTTGSIPAQRNYTIRKSVLQASPTSVCIIRPNGTRSGDC